MREIPLHGGNMAEVVRIGHVVRKAQGSYFASTRQVLAWLEHVGFARAPRIVDIGEATVDSTYLRGSALDPSLDGWQHIGWLHDVGASVRAFHEAMRGFVPEGEDFGVPWPITPQRLDLVCHNDLSPWNTIVDERGIVGFIDWDLPSIGSVEWELAWVIWRFVPLYPSGARIPFTVDEQAERLLATVRAYGVNYVRTGELANEIDRRMACGLESVEVLG